MVEYEERQQKQRNANREPANERGYDAVWSKARKAYLTRTPLCERCLGSGLLTPAVLVHHIKPLDQGGDRLNANNLMALCRDCHETVHGRKK